jgi:hypothetical protein
MHISMASTKVHRACTRYSDSRVARYRCASSMSPFMHGFRTWGSSTDISCNDLSLESALIFRLFQIHRQSLIVSIAFLFNVAANTTIVNYARVAYIFGANRGTSRLPIWSNAYILASSEPLGLARI